MNNSTTAKPYKTDGTKSGPNEASGASGTEAQITEQHLTDRGEYSRSGNARKGNLVVHAGSPPASEAARSVGRVIGRGVRALFPEEEPAHIVRAHDSFRRMCAFRVRSLILFLHALASDLTGWHRYTILFVAKTASEAIERPHLRSTSAEVLNVLHSCPVLRETGDLRARLAAQVVWALRLAIGEEWNESAHAFPLPEDVAPSLPLYAKELPSWKEPWVGVGASLGELGWHDEELQLWFEGWERARKLEAAAPVATVPGAASTGGAL